ncbi:hypothetical protein BRD09_08115 [Halobacteriales archaeon SW_10_68_16]|nr:MAG: hypothetical protein BRD09_08115 [Halobacteriales archaeon SW_10_68_16]
MEVPQLVRERLGDESVEGTVSLGDEDVVCVTPTRTFVYRGEGLLSDESVSVYAHDVERFDVSEGRRKTKFVFEYVEESDSFTVPGDRAETVLKLLLGGILHVAGVTVDGESIGDVFSFSELTLVVTSNRLVKHVGASVWDEDFEEYPYADVTGLSFEEGSVATQVVLSVEGRPHRIKAPSEKARTVERALKQALFAYHDVDSLDALNEKVGEDDAEPEPDDEAGSLSLDDGISPLAGPRVRPRTRVRTRRTSAPLRSRRARRGTPSGDRHPTSTGSVEPTRPAAPGRARVLPGPKLPLGPTRTPPGPIPSARRPSGKASPPSTPRISRR